VEGELFHLLTFIMERNLTVLIFAIVVALSYPFALADRGSNDTSYAQQCPVDCFKQQVSEYGPRNENRDSMREDWRVESQWQAFLSMQSAISPCIRYDPNTFQYVCSRYGKLEQCVMRCPENTMKNIFSSSMVWLKFMCSKVTEVDQLRCINSTCEEIERCAGRCFSNDDLVRAVGFQFRSGDISSIIVGQSLINILSRACEYMTCADNCAAISLKNKCADGLKLMRERSKLTVKTALDGLPNNAWPKSCKAFSSGESKFNK